MKNTPHVPLRDTPKTRNKDEKKKHTNSVRLHIEERAQGNMEAVNKMMTAEEQQTSKRVWAARKRERALSLPSPSRFLGITLPSKYPSGKRETKRKGKKARTQSSTDNAKTEGAKTRRGL